MSNCYAMIVRCGANLDHWLQDLKGEWVVEGVEMETDAVGMIEVDAVVAAACLDAMAQRGVDGQSVVVAAVAVIVIGLHQQIDTSQVHEQRMGHLPLQLAAGVFVGA